MIADSLLYLLSIVLRGHLQCLADTCFYFGHHFRVVCQELLHCVTALAYLTFVITVP